MSNSLYVSFTALLTRRKWGEEWGRPDWRWPCRGQEAVVRSTGSDAYTGCRLRDRRRDTWPATRGPDNGSLIGRRHVSRRPTPIVAHPSRPFARPQWLSTTARLDAITREATLPRATTRRQFESRRQYLFIFNVRFFYARNIKCTKIMYRRLNFFFYLKLDRDRITCSALLVRVLWK